VRRAPAIHQADISRALDSLGPFERRPHIAIAVSGGADSMALALAVAAWARARGGRATGLTVDHGLRPAAASEARQVRAWLRRHDIAHATLRWLGGKPATGIQAAARDARYALLESWCRANGVLHLALGHHRDDLIETARLRAAAGSGPLGRAGMSRVVELAHVRVLRPLLHLPKSALTGFLMAHGQAWLEDPSNIDPRFARARMRAAPAPHAVPPLAPLGRRRRAIERAAGAMLARAVELHPAGWAWLTPEACRGASAALIELCLARVLISIGGGGYAPSGASLGRLAAWLGAGARGARTLGGCRLIGDAAGGPVLICREAGRAARPRRLEPDGSTHWDGRYFVAAAPDEGSVAALGQRRLPGWDLAPAPGPVRPALPGLVARGGTWRPVALPGLPPTPSNTAVTGAFRPLRPLAAAPFMPAMPAARGKKSIV